MRRAAAAVLIALVALGILTATACEPVDEASPAAGPDRGAVMVIGDSLTVGAGAEGGLDERLRAHGFDPAVVAVPGQDVSWGLDEVVARTSVPSLVIVELGTNPDANVAGFAEQVNALVAALRDHGAEHIAWLTPIHTVIRRYEDKIDVLEAAAAAGAIVVADWRAVVVDHPEWMSRDGIHYTTEGYEALARFLTATAVDLADT
ncbi:MAG: SGNH/GDSL hydrolase family protein [Acidimicrobiales bacterium]